MGAGSRPGQQSCGHPPWDGTHGRAFTHCALPCRALLTPHFLSMACDGRTVPMSEANNSAANDVPPGLPLLPSPGVPASLLVLISFPFVWAPTSVPSTP